MLGSGSSDHSDHGSLGCAVSLASSRSQDKAVHSPSPIVLRFSWVWHHRPWMATGG